MGGSKPSQIHQGHSRTVKNKSRFRSGGEKQDCVVRKKKFGQHRPTTSERGGGRKAKKKGNREKVQGFAIVPPQSAIPKTGTRIGTTQPVPGGTIISVRGNFEGIRG